MVLWAQTEHISSSNSNKLIPKYGQPKQQCADISNTEANLRTSSSFLPWGLSFGRTSRGMGGYRGSCQK